MNFEYKGHKVEIQFGRITGRGYSAFIDGFAWAWGWRDEESAVNNARQLIDEETWQHFCDFNTSHDHPEANTKEAYAEWCADREAEDWR
jgi:hypothetical protein